jgi:hypothetical protein
LFLVTLVSAVVCEAQDSWTTLFHEDFENGATDAWQLDPGWQVQRDGDNSVLSATGHGWARMFRRNWTDYCLAARVKLIREGIHVNVRVTDKGRYFVSLDGQGITIYKQFWPGTVITELGRVDFSLTMGEWHNVLVTAQGNSLRVTVDGAERLSLVDDNDPFEGGGIAFESVWDDESRVYCDDIDVLGAAPPGPPSIPDQWAVVFQDRFESGYSAQWDSSGLWQIATDDGNQFLRGEGHSWAMPSTQGWADCVIEARFRLVTGGYNLNFRFFSQQVSNEQVMISRYILSVSMDDVVLGKQLDNVFSSLADSPGFVDPGWHVLRLVLNGPLIRIYLDNALALSFTDPESPLLFGALALEPLDDSSVEFDDVVVFAEPRPAPPSGYTWFKTGGPSGGLGYDVRIHPTETKSCL